MTQPRHVEFKSSVCSLCGGTHYGSTECPYRCDRCKFKIDQCAEEGCPRNARFAAENAIADERIVAAASKRTDAFVLREIAECNALTEGQKAFLRRLAAMPTEVEQILREAREYVAITHMHTSFITTGATIMPEPCSRCELRKRIDAVLSPLERRSEPK